LLYTTEYCYLLTTFPCPSTVDRTSRSHLVDCLQLDGARDLEITVPTTQQYGDWCIGRCCVGYYIWYSKEGPRRVAAPPSPLLERGLIRKSGFEARIALIKILVMAGVCAFWLQILCRVVSMVDLFMLGSFFVVPNIIAHPSTAIVPTSYYLIYLCMLKG